MTLFIRPADLNQFPSIIPHPYTHISVGDLHGNALKLLYILLEEGFLYLEKKAFQTLRDIYHLPVYALSPHDLVRFKTMIQEAAVVNKATLLLIGDELADRGNNDYFTLLILQKLHEARCNLTVILSNHNMEFIRDYERPRFTGVHYLGDRQGCSLSNLYYLIYYELINEAELRSLIRRHYQPIVKALDYTQARNGAVCLFTHAPVGLETIEALAIRCQVPYHDESPELLFQSIDAINAKISDLIARHSLLAFLDENPAHPLFRLIWNRKIGAELRTKPKGKFMVHFVHGHIGPGKMMQQGLPLASHDNLDTLFGKTDWAEKTGSDSGYLIQHLTRRTFESQQEQKS